MNELEHHGPELQRMCTPKRLERDAATGKISLTVERDGLEEVCGLLPARPPAARPCFRPHTHLPATTPQTIDGFDAVLSAIGRKPVTDALQLDKAGVKVDAQGLVQVGAFENTSAPTLANLTLPPTPTPTPAPTWSRWMPSRTPLPPP